MDAANVVDRTYYWEHATDESRRLRSASAQEMASVAHAAGGEVGVIIDDGGPLVTRSVPLGPTVEETTLRLEKEVGGE